MRNVLGALCVAAATAVLAVVAAGPASATSPTLRSSSPAAGARLSTWPDAATLTFGDAVAKGTPLVRVDGPDGAVASTGRATSSGRTVTQRLVARAAAGEYTLRWTVVLIDGTQLAGTIPFTFGTGAAPDGASHLVAAAAPAPGGRSNPAVAALLVGVIAVILLQGLRRLRNAFRR